MMEKSGARQKSKGNPFFLCFILLNSTYTTTFQPTKPSRCPHQALTVVSSRRAGRWKKEKEEKRAISEQCL